MKKGSFLTALFACAWAAPQTTPAQQVVAYPPANYSVASSEIVSLSVGGQPVYVEKFQNYQYARFGFSAPVECVVTVKDKIDAYAIHPRIRNIAGQAVGNVLRFTLAPDPVKPGYLVVDIGKLGHLVILGDKPEADAPDPAGAKVRLITAAPYAADTSGKGDCTAAIQKAIGDISAAGGGTLYFPKGVYRVIKTLQAKSGVSLYLAPGASIRSSPDKADYAAAAFLDPMIETNGVSDFRIFGRGTWDASGMDLMVRANTSNRRRLFSGGGANKNISLEGVVLRDATTWTIVMQNADSCLVRNVKIVNHWDQADVKIQNDGIDLCASRHGTAEANFVMTGDDGMCAKGNGKETAWLTFKHNVVSSFAAANKVGMQSTGPVHDILFSGNEVVSCRRGIVVESLEGGETMSKIRFENISIDGYQSLPGWAQHPIEMLAEQAPLSAIAIANVISYVAKPSNLDGQAHGISGVAITGLWAGTTPILSAAQGDFTLKNAADVTFAAGPPPTALAAPRSRSRYPREASGAVAASAARFLANGTAITPARLRPTTKALAAPHPR